MKKISPYSPCFLCPRRCGIERDCPGGKKSFNNKEKNEQIYGYCGESASLRLACASIHRGEEPPICGAGGSGTIFASGCNLKCAFCQNSQINGVSHNFGRPADTAEFARICLTLQERGAENINIVTGSHAVPAIAAGIAAAKAGGLHIPVLWNSSGYELPETLALLEDTADVFLPDLKTLDSGISGQYFNAPDYPEAAAAAIEKMLKMRGLRYDGGRLVSGVMVRHLVLPGHIEATRGVLRWFAGHCAGRALLSLMFQYTPPEISLAEAPRTQSSKKGTIQTTDPSPRSLRSLRLGVRASPEKVKEKAGSIPDRYINQKEYDTVLGWLQEYGIEDGYCQELVPGNTDWLPDFGKENPFPSSLSVPVWHWKNGFI